MKKKVLVISTINFEFNGITNVILNYHRNINKEKIQYDYVVINKVSKEILGSFELGKSQIFELPSRFKKTYIYIQDLKKVLKDGKYNAIHVHGNSGTMFIEMFIAKLCRVPMRILHSHNSTCKYKFIHKILKVPMLKLSTINIGCSHKAGEWLFGEENYILLENGIELEKYSFKKDIRDEYRKKLNVEKNKVIGHIGHFSYQKNHEYLIEVFNKVYSEDNSYKLLLVGDGDFRKEIENKVKELELENAVIFMGKTPKAPELMQAMDVLVFPSRFEGLPLTLVEAQTSGLPCLISDKVSKEAKLSNLVEYLELEKKTSEWAKKILNIKFLNRDKASKNTIESMISKGYSIKHNIGKLEKIYLQNK